MDLMRAVGLAHLQALRNRLDVVANNIANVNSTGFKTERARFRTSVFEMPQAGGVEGLGRVQFILPAGVFRDMAQGAIDVTNNPLDVAIDGEGFFVVETADGERLYTRAGNFTLNADRELVTATGERVLDDSGAPIAFTVSDNRITIDEDGKIFTERGEVAQLGLVRFDRPQQLERRGNGLLTSDETPIPVDPGETRIVQGALERANVKPIVEMTRMIKILRSYQEMQRALDRSRETEQRALDRLPRVQA